MRKTVEETDTIEEEEHYRAWVVALKDETLTEYAQRQFDGSLKFSNNVIIFDPLFDFPISFIRPNTLHISRNTTQIAVCSQQSPEDEGHCHDSTERPENVDGRPGNVRRAFEGEFEGI